MSRDMNENGCISAVERPNIESRCISPVSFWSIENLAPNSAWYEHAPFAFWLMESLRPRSFVELGTHGGFSYFAFCQAVQRLTLGTKCHAVDTWLGDDHAGLYGEEVFSAVRNYNDKHYSEFSDLVRSTFAEARAHFSDGSIDLLHIDGRHFYEDVKEDYEAWRPKLSDRAVVLFHDTNVRERDFGVFRLWEELSKSYPSFEFLHGHGLGVLGFGKDIPNAVTALFDSAKSESALVSVRSAYARLGSAIAFESRLLLQRQEIHRELKKSQEANVALNSALGKIDVLTQQSKEAAAALNTAHRETKNLNEKLRDREASLVEFGAALKKLEAEVSERDRRISQIKNSTSWRFTAPYRFLGNKIRQISKRSISHSHEIVELEKNYAEWFRSYGSLTDVERMQLKQDLDRIGDDKKISIIMPVYNPKIGWLGEAIDSVINQSYRNWELCIADDRSVDPIVRTELSKFQERDKRIKVVFRQENGHISEASNTAIEIATGDWIALLDQDDLLADEALYYVIATIQQNPDASIIYSDEDKFDETGQRFSPYFKSDWNPDLFLSHNMISHLGVFRTDLVKRVRGFRKGYEGSQDYDLALRCIEEIKPNQIVHIPRVLYHWRSHSDSTAQAGSNKNYALLAGQRVLNEHYERKGINATAELLDFGMYRAHYKLPDALPLVSLIIPTRNGYLLLKQCIDSILEKTKYSNYELIVVDNGSDDPQTLGYLSEISKDTRVRVVRDDQPFNYSAINNRAVKDAHGEYVGLINNDIEVISSGWLGEMVSLANQPGVGAVGARLLYPNDTVQHGGVILGLGGVAGHAHCGLPRGEYGYFGRAKLIQTLSAVTAACLVIKKAVYEGVGGLDEVNLKVAFNDVDFCLRVRDAGYRNVWTPYAELYHHESASRGYEDTPEKQVRFVSEMEYMLKRWGNNLQEDPAYNPNLTLDRQDFSLAWPPRI